MLTHAFPSSPPPFPPLAFLPRPNPSESRPYLSRGLLQQVDEDTDELLDGEVDEVVGQVGLGVQDGTQHHLTGRGAWFSKTQRGEGQGREEQGLYLYGHPIRCMSGVHIDQIDPPPKRDLPSASTLCLPVALMRQRNLLISMRSVVHPLGLGGTVAPSISPTESANSSSYITAGKRERADQDSADSRQGKEGGQCKYAQRPLYAVHPSICTVYVCRTDAIVSSV